jgi:hypothetical protein
LEARETRVWRHNALDAKRCLVGVIHGALEHLTGQVKSYNTLRRPHGQLPRIPALAARHIQHGQTRNGRALEEEAKVPVINRCWCVAGAWVHGEGGQRTLDTHGVEQTPKFKVNIPTQGSAAAPECV